MPNQAAIPDQNTLTRIPGQARYVIELSIVEDNTEKSAAAGETLPLRHSGEGRNPARHIIPRSGQSHVGGVVPLVELLVKQLAV
jgi:hypothetical protein